MGTFRNTLGRVAASFVVVGALLPLARAQELPNPTPVKPPEEPAPDIGKWKAAYEQSGRPTVLVLCGVSDGLIEAGGAGKIIWNYDADGVPSSVAAALESIINPPDGSVELVHLNSLHAAKERLTGVLGQRGEQEAIDLIARDLNAERVITIRLTPSAGAGPKVVVSCADAARGRSGFETTFDWKGGFDARNIKLNMRAVACRFIDDYALRASTALRSITLRFMGLASDPDSLRAARDAIRAAPGVTDVKRRNSAAALGDSVIEYEVRHGADADLEDLLLDIQKSLQTRIGAGPVKEIKREGSSVTLRVEPKLQPQKAQDVAWTQLITSPGADGDDARARLRDLWKKKNSPKIAVLVNRRATDQEARQAGASGGPAQVGTLVVVSGSGDAGALNGGGTPPRPTDPAHKEEFRQPNDDERIARDLEAQVGRLFGPDLINLTTVQSDVARAKLLERAQKQQSIMRQEDLSRMLVSLGVADIYVIGYANASEGKLQCNFNATTAEGINIGFSTYNDSYRDTRQVARQVFGELTLGMMRSWRPPAQMKVQLLGVADIAEFDALRKAINREGGDDLHTIGSEKFDKSTGEGVVEFYLEYAISSSELSERLRDIEANSGVPLPQFTPESKTDDLIQFRVRPAVVPAPAPAGSEPRKGG